MKAWNPRITVLFCLAAVWFGMTGCGKHGAADKKETSDGSIAEESEKKDTLVIGMQSHNLITDYKDNYLTHKVEDALGIDLEFVLLPQNSEEFREKVSFMTANAEELPDIIITLDAFSEEIILEYGVNGIFLPLNDYVENPDMMPNFNAIAKEDMEVIMDTIVSADGNIYGLPRYEPAYWNETPYRYWINEKWLDVLGLEQPETIEELHDVAAAFVHGDPNENGLKDEIGIYGFTSGEYGENILEALMNAFVFYNGGDQNGGLALDEDGKTVTAPFVSEEWREGLTVLRQWFEEGLIAPSVFTDDTAQFKATLNRDTNIVGLVTVGSNMGNWTDFDSNENAQEMRMIPPFEGPEGVCYTPYCVYTPSMDFFITSACENPALAIRMADYFYTEEMGYVSRWGEEGVDWTNDPEICSQYTNAFLEMGLIDRIDLVYNYKSDTKIWTEPSNKFWKDIGPRYFPLEKGNAQVSATEQYDPDSKSAQASAWNYIYYRGKYPKQILPPLKYTLEESKELALPIGDITAFVDASMADFISGKRSLNDGGWDEYLRELDDMGLGQWLAAAQRAYERQR